MTTEFGGGGSLLHDQRMQTVRDLLDRGMFGWRLVPPLDWEGSAQELCRELGGHNHRAIVFREGEQVVGCRLTCQCTSCLISQADFVLRHRSQLYSVGARSTSIMFDPKDAKAVELLQRERAEIEDSVEARKIAEPDRDFREKTALAGAVSQVAKTVAHGPEEAVLSRPLAAWLKMAMAMFCAGGDGGVFLANTFR